MTMPLGLGPAGEDAFGGSNERPVFPSSAARTRPQRALPERPERRIAFGGSGEADEVLTREGREDVYAGRPTLDAPTRPTLDAPNRPILDAPNRPMDSNAQNVHTPYKQHSFDVVGTTSAPREASMRPTTMHATSSGKPPSLDFVYSPCHFLDSYFASNNYGISIRNY